MIQIPIAQAHNRLSSLLKKIQKDPILLTSRGKGVGVLISPQEYERLRQFEAYTQVVRLSQRLSESGIKASDLYRSGRDELEGRQ